MTDYQRKLFSEILDLNWELNLGIHNEVVTRALHYRMNEVEELLGEDMGEDAWRDFKDKGRRMFAPA